MKLKTLQKLFFLAVALGAIITLAGRAAGAGKEPESGIKEAAKETAAPSETSEVKLTPEAVKRYGIGFGTANKQKLRSHLIVPAHVSFATTQMAVVGCPVIGRVADVRANVGDTVAKGDELLVVESPELGEAQSDYLQKRTAVAAADAAVGPAKSSYDRAQSLYESSKGIALTEVQKRLVEFNADQNALLTTRAGMKASESKLGLLGMDKKAVQQLAESGDINPRFAVRAPLTGTITERLVTLGELVKPDREKLIVLADMTTLWVLADVPESRLAEAKLGSKTVVSVGDQTFDGTISKIGLVVDSSTRSVSVRIELKADPALKPGMFAQVDIASSFGAEAGVVVPSSAIQSVDGSTAVFLAVTGEPNTFSRRMVSIGDSAGGMVSIVSGLEGGETIVTSGTFILKAELGKASAKDND